MCSIIFFFSDVKSIPSFFFLWDSLSRFNFHYLIYVRWSLFWTGGLEIYKDNSFIIVNIWQKHILEIRTGVDIFQGIRVIRDNSVACYFIIIWVYVLCINSFNNNFWYIFQDVWTFFNNYKSFWWLIWNQFDKFF